VEAQDSNPGVRPGKLKGEHVARVMLGALMMGALGAGVWLATRPPSVQQAAGAPVAEHAPPVPNRWPETVEPNAMEVLQAIDVEIAKPYP
jgi:hypothetical protein